MIDWCDKIMINKREHLLLGEVDNEAGSFFLPVFLYTKERRITSFKNNRKLRNKTIL